MMDPRDEMYRMAIQACLDEHAQLHAQLRREMEAWRTRALDAEALLAAMEARPSGGEESLGLGTKKNEAPH